MQLEKAMAAIEAALRLVKQADRDAHCGVSKADFENVETLCREALFSIDDKTTVLDAARYKAYKRLCEGKVYGQTLDDLCDYIITGKMK